MPYIYQVGFILDRSDIATLSMGSSLQRLISYVRALLPNEPGYITSRAMYSIGDTEKSHLIFESVWQTWEDIDHHRGEFKLNVEHLLQDIEFKVELQDLQTHIYEEIA